MSIAIRNVHAEELPAFVDSLGTGFLDRPDVENVAAEVGRVWDLDRLWGAFDGDRVCGTFRSFGTELTVPGGGLLPASAVSSVTVLPTHRRRGILRRLVAASHEASRARGEAASVLYASEYPIYGRFGYGPACRAATWTLDALGSDFHTGDVEGVELVTPSAGVAQTMRAVFDAWRPRQPGEIRRREVRWEYDLGLRDSAWSPRWKGFLAIHRDASGTADGYVRYRAEDRFEHRQPRGVITVDDLHAVTDDAYAALWRFVASVDLVATVKAEWRSASERLPWLLTNARAAEASEIGDALWLRLHDVGRALEARTYTCAADIVLEVVDREVENGRTRLHLDVGPDGARCRPTDRSPDLTLDASALGAAYLGGAPLAAAVLATGADEHRAGALRTADAMLRTADEPWCSTFF